jgi:hypothetical protein
MQTPGEVELADEEAAVPFDLAADDIEEEDVPSAIEEP